ncbi:signal recognition particle subunit srp68 [Zalaria obscura]|uniref:Signal recognition particle subunit srp68 n=1 Tax=Zalaria obscura TaxID=2024903 RepID=A0ACC3SKK3_9PEZI
MDITQFAVGGRDSALLIGDYNAYRSQLSRQLLAVRKRLGRATPKNAKFAQKAPVTAENVAQNREYAHLLLLTAERAWAHAMHMKSTHSEDNAGQGIAGSTRAHIISRLSKAARSAAELVTLLQDPASNSSNVDLLEAKAYVASLLGGEEFEKQSEGQRSREEQSAEGRWNKCLQELATARVIYAALYTNTKEEIFREILANTTDPTIRYAAYQARLPRTVAVSSVALRYIPKEDTELVNSVKEVDANAFNEQTQTSSTTSQAAQTGDVPNTITWRGRKANIVDATIGQALASQFAAESRLSEFLSTKPDASPRKKAAAYDDILIASQDAADATRQAIEELEKERVDEGDARMQDLRVTSLALNYSMVSWRVGRNRVLIGSEDGKSFEDVKPKQPKRPRRDGKEWTEKEEPRGRKLARLRERVVLYDATIQSIDTIKELRGAMRDEAFVAELEGKRAYFQALRCLNIAHSHTLLSNHLNALALLSRATSLISQTLSSLPSTSASATSPPTLEISYPQATALQSHLEAETNKHRALVDLYKFHANASIAAAKNMGSAAPIVQRLDEYPTPGVQVDLNNLVTYPPKLEPVPVKPLFFDVAWNYIDYPGRAKKAVEEQVQVEDVREKEEVNGVEEQPKKRGWFGFGR